MAKRYNKQREIVLYEGLSGIRLTDELITRLPEVRIRFNRGKVFKEPLQVKSSRDVAGILKTIYGRDITLQEQFVVLFLDRSNKPLGYYKHTTGGVDSTLTDLRLILAAGIKALASSMIISHNHPSGNTSPSPADLKMTKELGKAGYEHKIVLLDHLIVVPGGDYYSFADNGHDMGVPKSIKGVEGVKEKDIVARLRQEVLARLKESNHITTPHICKMTKTKQGYLWIEKRIIEMVIADGVTPSAAIAQLETQFE